MTGSLLLPTRCVYRAPAGERSFVSPSVFRAAWFAFLDHLVYVDLFRCPICCDDPKVLVGDGTAILLKEKHYVGVPITQPSTAEPVTRDHRRAQRCALSGPGTAGWSRARQLLWRLAHRIHGSTQGLARRAPPAGMLQDHEVQPLILALPLAMRGAVQLMCVATGVPCDMPTGNWAQAGDAILRVAARAQPGQEERSALARFLFSLASDSPVCSYLPASAAAQVQLASTGQQPLTADQLAEVGRVAPLVHSVICMFQAWGVHAWHFDVWRVFWLHLVQLSDLCHSGADAGPLLA